MMGSATRASQPAVPGKGLWRALWPRLASNGPRPAVALNCVRHVMRHIFRFVRL